MRVDLSHDQWDFLSLGRLMSPDGTAYFRRGTRMKRREVDEVVEQGSPVVAYWYGSGQLEWCDGDDAREQWRTRRGAFTADEPLPGKTPVWTGGLWTADDAPPLIVLAAHC